MISVQSKMKNFSERATPGGGQKGKIHMRL